VKANRQLWLRVLVIVLAFAPISQVAAAKSSHRPRVYVDASLIDGLVAAPVPNYPVEAVKKDWSGFGVFELRFRPDGTVKDVVTLLTTEHELLDDTARAALWQWRCQPRAQWNARLTISFSTHHRPVTLDPQGKEVKKNMTAHPMPTYPLEARRMGWGGTALLVMRFRADGSVEKVVALRSSGHPVLDDECVRTLQRWHCRPGVYATAYIPVTFTMGR
jgi:TonB family protein